MCPPIPPWQGSGKKGSEEMCVCVLLCKCNTALDVMPLHDGVRRKVEKNSVLFLLRLVSESQKNKQGRIEKAASIVRPVAVIYPNAYGRTVNKKGKQKVGRLLSLRFTPSFFSFVVAQSLLHALFKTYRAAATESSPPQRSSSAPTQRLR